MNDCDLVRLLSARYSDRRPKLVWDATRRLVEERLSFFPQAFWHPLGFFRIELCSDDVGLRYFLHFWPDGRRSTQDPSWMIHRHVWDLESLVLIGGLGNREYDRREGDYDGEFQGPLYVARVQPGQSVLERTSEGLSLEHASEGEVEPGRFYRVDIGKFHQTQVAESAFCCTLVRIGPRLRPLSQVMGDWDGGQRVTYIRVPVDEEIVRDCLDRVIS